MAKLDLTKLVRNFPENGVKRLLENQPNARSFLQIVSAIGEKKTQQAIGAMDLSRLRRENTTLVKADYRHLISDIILSAPMGRIKSPKKKGAAKATIYILIEHLSTPERVTPLVVLDYVTQIYASQARQWSKTERSSSEPLLLDPVLPIVFYTGSQSWTEPRSLKDLVDQGEDLSEFIPRFSSVFFNLRSTAEEELLSRGGYFGWVLRLFQPRKSDTHEFESLLSHGMQELEKMARRERDRWLELITFVHAMIHHERSPREQKRFNQTILNSVKTDPRREEVLNMVKTSAQVLKEEGEREGIRKGKRDEARDILLLLLRQRFGKIPAKQVRFIQQTEDLQQLNQWIKGVYGASSLKDLGIG